ncbi:iridoid synthase CYC2-like [Pistacia vera]|uniref:iridoid synthase CYC2-like n=1 Tax=Pistacia vera TaxID=55513 RepID=UPI001263A3D6|nr:iridoid synthase CYC2-like [Pistacia vera]
MDWHMRNPSNINKKTELDVFWVAFHLYETKELNVAKNSAILKNVLDAITNASPSRLRHVTLQTGTKHYMGLIFDPSLAGKLVRHELPFVEDSSRLPYPNFYYALEDLVASYSPALTFSVHRSYFIIRASSRSVHNMLLSSAVYASICKHQKLLFHNPGTRYTLEHFCDMTDASVLAQQQTWAALSDKAKNQAFNCTNGDVFTWKSLWKVLCELFEVKFVEFDDEIAEGFDLVEMMKEKGGVWDEIVEKQGLFNTKLEEIIRFDAFKIVLNFDFQHICSMNKSREFGFHGYVDSLKSIKMWVDRLRGTKIIP